MQLGVTSCALSLSLMSLGCCWDVVGMFWPFGGGVEEVTSLALRVLPCRAADLPPTVSTITVSNPWVVVPVEENVALSFEVRPCVGGGGGGWRGITSLRSPACCVVLHAPEVAPGRDLLESLRWSEASDCTLVPTISPSGPTRGYVPTWGGGAGSWLLCLTLVIRAGVTPV
jgi:hypothetical protein